MTVEHKTGHRPNRAAVAALVISILALAIALYAAFAPRQMVETGAETLVHVPEAADELARMDPETAMTLESVRRIVKEEVEYAVDMYREEYTAAIEELRSEVAGLEE